MKSNSVLFTKEKSIIKYNGPNDSIDWEVDFDNNIIGISRVDDYISISQKTLTKQLYFLITEKHYLTQNEV